MKTWTKPVALMPLLALVAACNATSPSMPDPEMMAGPEIAVDGQASAQRNLPGTCRGVNGVSLTVARNRDGSLSVKASYVSTGSSNGCPAPVWTSDPSNALGSGVKGFVVQVQPVAETVEVVATAPNGIRGVVTVVFRPTALGVGDCRGLTGVTLKRVPVPQRGTVIEATYEWAGPVRRGCPAPQWSSDPAGMLDADRDPFRARLTEKAIGSLIVVTATSPNGVAGTIKVQG